MTKRRSIVAANWKMAGSHQLSEQVIEKLQSLAGLTAQVVICPPSVYLAGLQGLLNNTEALQSSVAIGGQNVSQHQVGAYTGEISAAMLKQFGCQYVIVGHSERRNLYGESSQLVAEKFVAVQQAGLTPILCIGESLEAREQQRTFAVLDEELNAVLNTVGIDAFSNAVIAYEPVWAIGTGRSASPEQAQEVHRYIRQKLSEQSQTIGDSIQILYGGSVKPDNAAALFGQPDVDGGLVGGASLDANDFASLCQIASETE